MPLLFGTDRKKLSKRHGATKLEELTDQGFIVDVVRNYLCFLSTEFDESMVGWTLDDLVHNFDVEKLGTSPSIFDPEKLRWMNGRFIRGLSDAELADRLLAYLVRVRFFEDCDRVIELVAEGPAALAAIAEAADVVHAAPVPPSPPQAEIVRVVAPLVREKIELLADFVPLAAWFFKPLAFSQEAHHELATIPEAARTLRAAAVKLAEIEAYDIAHIEAAVRSLPQELGVKPKLVFAALRLGMSGQSVTPGLFESLWALGRDEAAGRLAAAAALLEA